MFPSGESNLFLWSDHYKTLLTFESDKESEHEDKVESIDVHPQLGLLVTGDSEGLIKVWNCKK